MAFLEIHYGDSITRIKYKSHCPKWNVCPWNKFLGDRYSKWELENLIGTLNTRSNSVTYNDNFFEKLIFSFNIQRALDSQ